MKSKASFFFFIALRIRAFIAKVSARKISFKITDGQKDIKRILKLLRKWPVMNYLGGLDDFGVLVLRSSWLA
jgi:hypothetical protein